MGSGTAVDCSVVNFSITELISLQYVGKCRIGSCLHDPPVQRNGCRKQGAQQECSRSPTLAAFKIPVGGGYAIFPRRDLVFIHSQTGRTARLTHLETGFTQYVVNSLFPYLVGYLTRSGYTHCLLLGGLPAPYYDSGNQPT